MSLVLRVQYEWPQDIQTASAVPIPVLAHLNTNDAIQSSGSASGKRQASSCVGIKVPNRWSCPSTNPTWAGRQDAGSRPHTGVSSRLRQGSNSSEVAEGGHRARDFRHIVITPLDATRQQEGFVPIQRTRNDSQMTQLSPVECCDRSAAVRRQMGQSQRPRSFALRGIAPPTARSSEPRSHDGDRFLSNPSPASTRSRCSS